jgi:hypothetical protein
VLNKRICEFISKQCSLQSLSIHCLSLESETIIKLLRNLTDLTCLDLRGSTGVAKRSKQWQPSAIYAIPISLYVRQPLRVNVFNWDAFVAMFLRHSSLTVVYDKSNAVSFDN